MTPEELSVSMISLEEREESLYGEINEINREKERLHRKACLMIDEKLVPGLPEFMKVSARQLSDIPRKKIDSQIHVIERNQLLPLSHFLRESIQNEYKYLIVSNDILDYEKDGWNVSIIKNNDCFGTEYGVSISIIFPDYYTLFESVHFTIKKDNYSSHDLVTLQKIEKDIDFLFSKHFA